MMIKSFMFLGDGVSVQVLTTDLSANLLLILLRPERFSFLQAILNRSDQMSESVMKAVRSKLVKLSIATWWRGEGWQQV